MLQDLDKVTSQKNLAEKYSIPQITISTWKKSRAKVLAGYEKGLDSKRIKPEMCEKINKTPTLQWWIHWLWSWIIDQAKYPDRQVYHLGSSRKFCWYYLRWSDMKVREVESIRKPLIEEVRTDIETLEKFSLYSKFGEVVMKSTRRVNHYVSP